jgi:hypothetical protein
MFSPLQGETGRNPNTTPILRCSGTTLVGIGQQPVAEQNAPDDGRSKAAMSRSMVVLPQPLAK